jgi:hypothetical protein
MTDMGVESGIFRLELNAFTKDADEVGKEGGFQAFLPIPDVDHGMHHVTFLYLEAPRHVCIWDLLVIIGFVIGHWLG